jgi:hypothetical protein
VAEEFEAGAAEHVAFDLLSLRVDAFRPAVVMQERDRGGGGLEVEFESAGERVQVRQVSGPRGGDPLPQLLLVGKVGTSIEAKEPIRSSRAVISGQADASRSAVSL